MVHLPLALGGWGAGDNKKNLLRSSVNSQDFYDHQHLGHLPLALDGLGARDNNKSLLRSSINPQDNGDPQRLPHFFKKKLSTQDLVVLRSNAV